VFLRNRSHDTAPRVRNPSCNNCCSPPMVWLAAARHAVTSGRKLQSLYGKSTRRPNPRYGFFLDQLVDKLPAFSETRNFVVMFTKIHNLTLNLMVQWFTPCLVFGNSRGQMLTRRPVIHNEPLCGFPQSHQANSWMENWIRPQPFGFTSFPKHCSLTILPILAIHSDAIIASQELIKHNCTIRFPRIHTNVILPF
jgi:hypothetical protein